MTLEDLHQLGFPHSFTKPDLADLLASMYPNNDWKAAGTIQGSPASSMDTTQLGAGREALSPFRGHRYKHKVQNSSNTNFMNRMTY